MAFQTNVFRDGQWRTETVDLNAVMRGSTTAAAPAAPPLATPPNCGLLTRTVIESPIARWVLPALLRSAHHNDVAFVGDRYVSISELRKDGQLQEVLRKNDFGCRIRNACVIGNKYERFRAAPDDATIDHIKSEDEDDDTHMADFASMSGSTGHHGLLPPHLLLVILESGTFVFLFIRRNLRGNLEFVTSSFHNPARRMGHHLGFHVAVDPRSRCIAVADAQNKFVVYELESMEAMSDQYMRYKAVTPVKAHQPRAVQGTILKMEFLYPRPEDQYHVILLLIVVRGDKSKMVIYEWERGDDLGQVFAEEKRGHRIRPEHHMPLLVIPLTVRSSFLVVSENAFGICKDPLQGPPDIENHYPFDPNDHPTTRFHHGAGPPLWTAWDRPVRRRGYYDTNDHIYLAREDGVIVYFEFNVSDVLGASMNVGTCNCNIASAFTTMYDAYSDFAIVAGDSGPGMVFEINGSAPFQRFIRRERLGVASAEVLPIDASSPLGHIMVCCNDSLLLLRDFESRRPGCFATRHRIWVTDFKDPSSVSVPVISATSIPNAHGNGDRNSLVLLSGERVSLVELHLREGPVPRRFPLPGTPVKMLYSKILQCLVVAVQVGDQPNIMFIDADTGSDLSAPYDKNGSPTTFINGLGGAGDRILAMCGRLLLVNPTNEDTRHSEANERRKIRFSTRYKVRETAPICSVVGEKEGIVYCAGKTLHWEVLDSAEKKLVRRKSYELNSPAISLQVVNGKICALSLSDSLVVIDHRSNHQSGEMELVHMDQVTRKSNDFFNVGDCTSGTPAWPVALLCGTNRDVAAVWTPWQERHKELEVVAEGTLSASVRKLGRGNVRPEWVATDHSPRYGSIPSTVDGAELLGVCLDGSVVHFNLLSLQAWRFLRLVQNLAMRSKMLFPYSYEVSTLDDEQYEAEVKETPRTMKHLDGDLLQRCYAKGVLEDIISEDSNVDLLREYLDDLDDGRWTAAFQDSNDVSRYYELAYDILEYYLSPVL
ncbi:hypothetical protein C8034_v007397 [Colletotrichum sidae]|uniref:RSE1/DDB1/CPSF1 first beta-propeller domain-containing protein n=1 Tax=Colletotrichum sidae TaxID=1347389 RepID=A0A4R8T5J4_9PEZI|nr:hypothetical protein C8034_v007397 [Colletotrichum sidae]